MAGASKQARTTHLPSTLVLLILLTSSGARAKEMDAELREALPVVIRVAREAPFEAEQMLETLTRSHSHDPRPWLMLARLRVKLGAGRSAALPLRRVAELGPGNYWGAVRKLQRKAGLEPLPERGEIIELAAFRERAARDACSRQRRDPDALPVCPAVGTPLLGEGPGPLACPHHVGDSLGIEPFLIGTELFHSASRAPEAWLRAEAVHRVDSRVLNQLRSRRFLKERHPLVRRALLERLLGAAPGIDYHPVVQALAREFAADDHESVRMAAWKLLHTQGEVPRLAMDDLRLLVRAADRGHISRYLVRAICRAEPGRSVEALAGLLREPSLEGQRVAIRVLAMDGGQEGLLHLARALSEPGPAFAQHAELAARSLREATGEDHGANGRAWLESLER